MFDVFVGSTRRNLSIPKQKFTESINNSTSAIYLDKRLVNGTLANSFVAITVFLQLLEHHQLVECKKNPSCLQITVLPAIPADRKVILSLELLIYRRKISVKVIAVLTKYKSVP